MGNNQEEKVGRILSALYLLKVKVEEAEAALDSAKDEYQKAESIALEQMIDADLLSASTEEANFRVKKVFKYWILADCKQRFIDWAKQNPHAKGIVKEDVNFKTLNSWAKECVEKGLEIPETVKSGQSIELDVKRKRS